MISIMDRSVIADAGILFQHHETSFPGIPAIRRPRAGNEKFVLHGYCKLPKNPFSEKSTESNGIQRTHPQLFGRTMETVVPAPSVLTISSCPP